MHWNQTALTKDQTVYAPPSDIPHLVTAEYTPCGAVQVHLYKLQTQANECVVAAVRTVAAL